LTQYRILADLVHPHPHGVLFEVAEAKCVAVILVDIGVLMEKPPERRGEGIHTNGFIGFVLVFLRHAQDTLALLGYTGPLHIELVLTDIRDVPWIAFPDGFAQTGTSCELDITVAFTLDTTTDDLEQRQDLLASEVLRLVFFAMNWPDIADSPGKLDAIIATGYEYNFWPTS
jgi:hypothetical protein